MAWSAKTQISSAVTVNTTTRQDQSTAVTLNPGESAHVQVSADLSTVSALLVYVLTTLDDTTETWDHTFMGPFILTNAFDPHVVSFVVRDVYKFALIYALNTGTDTVTVSAWYRKNGINL